MDKERNLDQLAAALAAAAKSLEDSDARNIDEMNARLKDAGQALRQAAQALGHHEK